MRESRIFQFAVVAFGVCLFAASLPGCSESDVKTIKADTEQLGKDAGPILKNSALAAKVNTHFTLHKGIDISGLHIETKDDQVTVGGYVRDEGMKKTVLAVVKETPGVEKVVDKLRIGK